MPIEALQPTACRSKSTLINTGQLETTHKECFNPHSTCWCRRRRTPSSCSQSSLHFRDSSAPQKGRAEASHIVALVSTITKTVGKLSGDLEQNVRNQLPKLSPEYWHSAERHISSRRVPCCFQGYPHQLKGRRNVKVLRYLTGKQLPESKHKCSPEQVH